MRLFGLEFFAGSKVELVRLLGASLSEKRLVTVATPNPEQIVRSQTDKQLGQDFLAFDYLLPDGIGLVWASQILRLFNKIPSSLTHKIAGVDVVSQLLDLAENRQLRVLAIGGRNYQNLAILLKRKNLQVNWTEGFKNVAEQTKLEQKALADLLKQVKPDLLLVAFGAPHQERWMIENRQILLVSGAKVAMAIGGSLEMLTGRIQRAPSWMRQFGLEWLWRLLQEPWRWRRQLALIEFVGLVVRSALKVGPQSMRR